MVWLMTNGLYVKWRQFVKMYVYYYPVLAPAEIYFQASSSSLTCMVCACSGTKEGIHTPSRYSRKFLVLEVSQLVWVSLSEPHTSGTALQDACVCMYVCLLACGHIPNI